MIHDCLSEFTRGANAKVRALVDYAFLLDKKGNVSVTRILGLRRVKIEHEQWAKAMDIIADSIQVVSSKEYIRFYRRNAEGEYEHVAMNLVGAGE